MSVPTEPDGAAGLDPAFAALLADPRIELRPPSANASIGDLRKGANAFLSRASGPDLPAVLSLAADDATPAVPLRLYRPSIEQDLPAILFIHGGGFVFGDLDTHDAMCRTLAIATGGAVIAVKYRCAPEAVFPAATDDCFEALAWLSRNATLLGLDVGRLAIAGDSAGGQLAIATAIRARDAGIALRHLALLYPLVDPACSSSSSHRFGQGFMLGRTFLSWCWSAYAGDTGCRQDPLFDLTLADLRGLPSVTIVTAGYDPLRDEGKELASRFERAGVCVLRHHYPDMIHGFAGLPGITPRALDAIGDIGAALRAALADLPGPAGR